MSFWSLPLSYTLRNVIFRFVHKKLPCSSLLGYIYKLPPSATWYTICNCHTVESATHLLFTYPPKHFMWNEIIFEFLWPTVDITDILESCLHLDFQLRLVYCKFSDVLSPAIVSLISLAEIWKAHFQCVFNSTAFNPNHILHSIRRQITIYIAEQALTDE
ncbi:MAG: hypothetical protein EXX96DRAFT_298550 [Benjaminiella poitrasii]|nr:MAG: hypothetical protein EXX96DRAFT_298550 [Benjaminiella poitrasii]